MGDASGNTTDDDFETVLEYVKQSRGFDFTGYKRTSLKRRVQHRMRQVGIDDYPGYCDQLQVNANEFAALFDTILINVTSFQRDPDTWRFLRESVVPKLLAERGDEAPIRVWSAGCASGEEAYSLAMMFAEALGAEQFRQRVKIYASDVDEGALAQARRASYTERDVRQLPAELVEKYFERQNGRYGFRGDLRRSVIFGRNDLVQDAPISRIDLLVCRNTLMYFNAETQAKILNKFQFGLAPSGVLVLGQAEMLLSHKGIFEAVDLKRRIFRKAAATSEGTAQLVVNPPVSTERRSDVRGAEQLLRYAYSASPSAQVVVTADDVIALVNQEAEVLFGLSPADVGRPLRDVEMSYRPVELRGYLEQARAERRPLRVRDVEWRNGTAEPRWFEVQVNPLIANENELLGIALTFHDASAERRLLDELEQANRQLESAYDELQSTNEELETTNEELQSTVEELETTNEELQSSNEELETMNEELQSTNDELQTINDALQERSGELDQVNEFLESILTSLRAGVIVIDREMRVLVWNRGVEDLWGLRRDEAEGQHLLNLDIGFPLTEVRPLARNALTEPGFSEQTTVRAVTRRGREAEIRVICSALQNHEGAVHGAILVMEQSSLAE